VGISRRSSTFVLCKARNVIACDAVRCRPESEAAFVLMHTFVYGSSHVLPLIARHDKFRMFDTPDRKVAVPR
jgi:hypothetical protein